MTLVAVRIGDLAEQVRGVSYGKEDASKVPLKGYLPVLRAGNITDTGLTYEDLVYVPATRISDKQKIKRGDIIVAASSGSLDVVGKAAPALQNFDGGFGAFCKVLRPNNKVDANYFAQFFKRPEYRKNVSALAAGANINNLRNEHLDDMLVPVPPLPEQRRIATILDQADALRAKRRETLAQLDSLTQSIFIEMFGNAKSSAKFPRGGIRALVEANSGKSAKSVLSEVETDIPIYGGNGINGWATKALYEQSVVVFGRVGQQCGNVCITNGPSWVTDNAIVVRIVESAKLNADYLLHAFEESDFSDRVKHLDLPFINQGMILDNPIPLPPFALQQTFSTRIKSVEALKTTHRAALLELDRLFASLQHRAFSGEL